MSAHNGCGEGGRGTIRGGCADVGARKGNHIIVEPAVKRIPGANTGLKDSTTETRRTRRSGELTAKEPSGEAGNQPLTNLRFFCCFAVKLCPGFLESSSDVVRRSTACCQSRRDPKVFSYPFGGRFGRGFLRVLRVSAVNFSTPRARAGGNVATRRPSRGPPAVAWPRSAQAQSARRRCRRRHLDR